jgi:hypothetical protein
VEDDALARRGGDGEHLRDDAQRRDRARIAGRHDDRAGAEREDRRVDGGVRERALVAGLDDDGERRDRRHQALLQREREVRHRRVRPGEVDGAEGAHDEELRQVLALRHRPLAAVEDEDGDERDAGAEGRRG